MLQPEICRAVSAGLRVRARSAMHVWDGESVQRAQAGCSETWPSLCPDSCAAGISERRCLGTARGVRWRGLSMGREHTSLTQPAFV